MECGGGGGGGGGGVKGCEWGGGGGEEGLTWRLCRRREIYSSLKKKKKF